MDNVQHNVIRCSTPGVLTNKMLTKRYTGSGYSTRKISRQSKVAFHKSSTSQMVSWLSDDMTYMFSCTNSCSCYVDFFIFTKYLGLVHQTKVIQNYNVGIFTHKPIKIIERHSFIKKNIKFMFAQITLKLLCFKNKWQLLCFKNKWQRLELIKMKHFWKENMFVYNST